MKTILFFCLLSIAAVAQKVASPPTLTYRQSNTNELNMIVSSAGQLLTPSNSMSITAEIRASDVGRIITTVSLATVSSQDGTIKGILPDLQPNIYYLGLFVDYANGQPDFRVGVARIEILPTGSLRSITDASGLNVQISETKQVLDIKLDATPSASVAAYYAGKAKQAYDSLSAYSHARDDGQDTQISARVTLTTYNNNRTADLALVGQKASVADLLNHTNNTANPHGVTAVQIQAIGFPVLAANVTALLAAATGPIPKFIICLSDPDFSDGPTINFWDGTNLSVFISQKRN